MTLSTRRRLSLAAAAALLLLCGAPAGAQTTCGDNVDALSMRLHEVGASMPPTVVRKAKALLKKAAAANKKGDGIACRNAYKRAAVEAGM